MRVERGSFWLVEEPGNQIRTKNRLKRGGARALNEAEGRYDLLFPLKEEHKPLVGLLLIQSLLSHEIAW